MVGLIEPTVEIAKLNPARPPYRTTAVYATPGALGSGPRTGAPIRTPRNRDRLDCNRLCPAEPQSPTAGPGGGGVPLGQVHHHQ
eukprot:751711-Hanusia_phi.AAC.10